MRRLAVFGVVAVLVLGIAAPVVADHANPVEGTWQTKDKFDKSRMFLTVEEVDDDLGIIQIEYVDTLATVGCIPAAPITLRASGEWYDDGAGNPEGRMLLHFEVDKDTDFVECGDGATLNPEFPDPLVITFELVNPVKLDDGIQKWKPTR